MKNLLTILLIAILFSNCEQPELIQDSNERTPPVVETINGFNDPMFMELIEPFEQESSDARVLEDASYDKVIKVIGDGYVNYTLSVGNLNDTGLASHALILSERNDFCTL